MFSKTAAEDVRVVVNLDFTLVVPKGMSYSTDPSEIGPEKVLVFTDGTRTFTLEAPKRTGMGRSFEDPVTKGVIRNYTAGLISAIYGREVRQNLLVESPGVLVLSADKSDGDGGIHFFIAADQGLYAGCYLLPQMMEKERLEAMEALFSTVREYTATRSEAVNAEKAEQAAIEKREEERKAKEAAQEAAEKEGTSLPAEDAKAPEQDAGDDSGAVPEKAGEEEKEPSPLPEAAGTEEEESAAPLENEEEEPSGQEASPEGGQEAAAPENAAPAKKEPEEAAPVEAPTEERGEQKAPEKTVGELQDEARKREEASLTAEEIHIRNLEEARKRKIENLRAKYIGNPGVEAQIDNYIARCERTADRITQEFRDYIVSVQNYAATTTFTGLSDPNYLAMLSDIEEAENSLGGQLDKVVQSADENATNAKNAKIREPYVERLIRLIDRLDRKYETLSVSMGGARTISYARPEEVSAIFKKWDQIRYSLPSYIEGSEAEVEKRVSEEVQKRISESRDAIPQKEAEIERKKQELETAAEDLDRKNEELGNFLQGIDDRRAAIDRTRKEKISQVDAEILDVENQISDKEQEIDRLTQSLARTFSLNVNRKKDLQGKIAAANEESDRLKDKLEKIRDRRKNAGAVEDRQEEEIEEEQEALEKERDDIELRIDRLREDLVKLQDEIVELQKTITDSEEEFRHIHENYLMGKYDRA